MLKTHKSEAYLFDAEVENVCGKNEHLLDFLSSLNPKALMSVVRNHQSRSFISVPVDPAFGELLVCDNLYIFCMAISFVFLLTLAVIKCLLF